MKRLSRITFRTEARRRRGLFGAAAALAVLLCAPACSDDDTEPPYVAVTSGSFTFSPNTAINTVQVEANTTWEVCWTPDVGGIVVHPASGRGDATLVVEQMPAGVSVRLAVSHGTGRERIVSNSVAVVRGTTPAESFLPEPALPDASGEE